MHLVCVVVGQNEENRVDVGEGQTVRLRLQRNVYTAGSVIVWWTTQSREAGAPRDYSPHSGSVTFTSAQHTAEISLTITDDRDNENLEVSATSFQTSHLCLHLFIMVDIQSYSWWHSIVVNRRNLPILC